MAEYTGRCEVALWMPAWARGFMFGPDPVLDFMVTLVEPAYSVSSEEDLGNFLGFL